MNNIHHKDILDMAVFHKIDINLYPLFIAIFEQKNISKVLRLMERIINQNNQLIFQKELQKKWLMQNLLTGNKRLKGFEKENKEFKD